MDKIGYAQQELKILLERVKADLKFENAPILGETFSDIENAITENNVGKAAGGFGLICKIYRDYKNVCRYVEETLRRIDNYEGSIAKKIVNKTDNSPIIFLSHSSKDLTYATPLRNFISGLGIENDRIIYTSHPNHNIPYGENIYEYLAEKIHKDSIMINLWSENYFNSLACICETGAAWVSGCNYEKICIPPLKFDDPRFSQTPIDIHKIGVILDGSDMCRTHMMGFGKKLISVFNLSNYSGMDAQVAQFITEIKRLETERLEEKNN